MREATKTIHRHHQTVDTINDIAVRTAAEDRSRYGKRNSVPRSEIRGNLMFLRR